MVKRSKSNQTKLTSSKPSTLSQPTLSTPQKSKTTTTKQQQQSSTITYTTQHSNDDNDYTTPVKKHKVDTTQQVLSNNKTKQPDHHQIHKGIVSKSHWQDLDDTEILLRRFDIDMTYGPCSGLTRLERWYRADKLGKNPPLYIRDILIDAAKQQQDIFNNNNTSKSSQSKQPTVSQALVVEDANFQLILRVLNTNVSGTDKVMYALTRIRGIGRRFSNIILKKADIDLNKRAGELTEEEIENIKTVISNPLQFNIPEWFLNNQKDRKDGKTYQVVSNHLDTKLRDNFERMKKIRLHRGLRHYWNLKVRGQHTKTTGRRGRTVGLAGGKA